LKGTGERRLGLRYPECVGSRSEETPGWGKGKGKKVGKKGDEIKKIRMDVP